MSTSPQADNEVVLVLLYRNNASELLIEAHRQGMHLPTIATSGSERIAREITDTIRNLWNLKTYCMFPLFKASLSDSIHYYVIEACSPDAAAPAGFEWRPTASLSGAAFRNSQDFWAIQDSLELLRQDEGRLSRDPFTMPGWLQTVTHWVQSQATGLSLTGEFQQLNASPTFSLLRFDTDGPALWFKAVGEPNTHEFTITLEMAKLFSRFLPRVVASKTEWNAWLSLESQGTSLNHATTSDEWLLAATELAKLQLASLDHVHLLIEAGSKSITTHSLLELVDPFFECMAELARKQTNSSPAWLTKNDITLLAKDVRAALIKLGEGRIPNALGHLDLNPGNILVSQKRVIFLDWAEGCVGPPFFTLQYLIRHRRRLFGPDVPEEKAIISAYTAPWQSVATLADISTQLDLTPLTAIFGYAASSPIWKRPLTRAAQAGAGTLRSLVGRMKRCADDLCDRRLTCAL